jgi:hypothetical protein
MGINLLNEELIQQHAREIIAIRAAHPPLDGLEFDPPDSEPKPNDRNVPSI